MYIAVGLALDAVGGGYANGALLFGRDGAIVGRYDKSFLWHFDNRWFEPGSAYPVFETDIGRIGMLVCADGRMPEIARCLTLNGAQIILDLTAWVSTGRTTQDLSTTQIQHLMPTRAIENGVWVACCDKFGVEAESIVYAGRSCFINPGGDVVAALGPDEDAALTYDVAIEDARPPVLRRPGLYETLTQPTASLPVLRTLQESFVPGTQERRIAVVQMKMPPTGDEFVEMAAQLDGQPGVAAIELNISCPNVAHGVDFGADPALCGRLVAACRAATSLPIIAKLTPNVTSIGPIAKAAEDGGADAISLINTVLGMAIDWRKRRPLLGNVVGGLSGPAIKPLVLVGLLLCVAFLLLMDRKVADALNQQGKAVRGSKVLVLGVAYKKDVDDPRESPSFELMDLLRKKGAVVSYIHAGGRIGVLVEAEGVVLQPGEPPGRVEPDAHIQTKAGLTPKL